MHFDPLLKIEDIVKDIISDEVLAAKHKERREFIASLELYRDEAYEEPFLNFDTKEAILWIDPLDGTSDFVKGNLEAVTTLIGLSIKGVSKLGVVHNAY